jgi:spermidine synthase
MRERRRPPRRVAPAAKPQESAARLTIAFWIATALFVLSGATALTYEVIWFKRFSQLWGNSALAAGAVVAAFLAGLGAGAYWIGRRADRVASPIRWYAISEAAIAVLAVALPFEVYWLTPLCSLFYRLSGGHLLLLSLMRAAATFVFLGPPCFLMGGTLPLLIRSFASSAGARDRYTAWFYAVNTLGAAAGCYVAGFHLLPSIGLAWTNILAAIIDLVIAAAGLMLGGILMTAPGSPPATSAKAKSAQANLPAAMSARWMIALAAALSGCAALILQMVWTRQLALILGGSAYAFSAMLFTILAGIGLGSLVSEIWLGSSSASIELPGVVAALALGLAVAACERAIPALTFLVGGAKELRGSYAFNGAISIAASAVLELLPALAMGFLFPIFVSLSKSRGNDAGRTVGEVYAANTIGSLIGSLATPLVLVPYWGSANTIALAVGMYAAVALLLISGHPPRDYLARVAVVAAAVVIVWASRVEQNPSVTNEGMYMYGDVAPEKIKTEARVLRYFREGAVADVMVQGAANQKRVLRVNGKVDASTGDDMATQVGLAYYPRSLRPAARDILVIGFGSGVTSGSSLLFPGTRVRCVEIEPAVYAASPLFADVNHSPEKSPQFSIAFDDARSYLQGSGDKFDLIISEPSNPWIAGVSNLFTREFYQTAREHLNRGGMLAQWVQLYSLSPSDYAMIARTVMSVFPHCALVFMPGTADTILVASGEPIGTSREAIEAAQAQVNSIPQVASDLHKYFGPDVFSAMFVGMMLDETGLSRMIRNEGPGELNTDLNLKLEFNAPLRLFEPERGREVISHIIAAADPDQFGREFQAWGGTPDKARLFGWLAATFAFYGVADSPLELANLGLKENPRDVELLADKMIASPMDQASLDEAMSALVADPPVASRAGRVLLQSQRYREAVQLFERLAALHPTPPQAWSNLAQSYEGIGEKAKAAEAFQKAIALDPRDVKIRQSYQEFLAQTAIGH